MTKRYFQYITCDETIEVWRVERPDGPDERSALYVPMGTMTQAECIRVLQAVATTLDIDQGNDDGMFGPDESGNDMPVAEFIKGITDWWYST